MRPWIAFLAGAAIVEIVHLAVGQVDASKEVTLWRQPFVGPDLIKVAKFGPDSTESRDYAATNCREIADIVNDKLRRDGVTGMPWWVCR
jgi:hypothetical protein